jgi:hypothetical protein
VTAKRQKAKTTAIHDDHLTALLVEAVLGWKAAPDRFIKPGRSWTPRTRFKPLTCLNDAFKLLKEARADYQVIRTRNGKFTASVRVGSGRGHAEGTAEARTIIVALAEALGLET